ncbi:MAG: hypothetical protein QXT31_05920 [Candidatus Bathyarchaeia archaeon]
MKNYKSLIKIACFLLIITIIVEIGLKNPVNAENVGAFFQKIHYNPKIYDGETEVFDFIIYNYNIDSMDGKPLFFIRLYANNAQIYDEYLSPWPCEKGTSTSHKVEVANWKGPKKYIIEAQLFLLNQTIPILLDTERFEITVVKLFISDWKQEPEQLSMEWGLNSPRTLTISFKNGGNDFMLNSSIKIEDLAGLIITPIYVQLSDIKPNEARIINYSILVPEIADIGNKVLRFQVKYFDFKGNEHVESKTAFIEITKLGTNLSLSYDGEAKFGSTLLLIAKLIDNNGNPIPNEKIDFYIDSINIGYNKTNKAGIAYLNYTLNLDAGEYSLKAIFEGSSKLASNAINIQLSVGKVSTFIEAILPTSISVDEPVNILVFLKDEKGIPVANQEVKLYVNASSFLTNKTDVNGEASINLILKRKGNYSLSIVYEGNKNFLGVRYRKSIVVNPIQTKLTLSLPWFPLKDSQLKISAFLKDGKNNPIPNAIVKFFVVEGDKKAKELGNSITDAKGIASIDYKPSKDGIIEVLAVYEGNQKYSESRAISSLNVINIILVLGIITATTLSILGAFLFLKFKKGIDIFSEIKKRFQKSKFLKPPVIKRVDVIEPISETLGHNVKNCINCGSVIPKSAYFWDKCGRKQDLESFENLQRLDEKVYNYILEHKGTISLSKACIDLGIKLEELKDSIGRLKKAGKLI